MIIKIILNNLQILVGIIYMNKLKKIIYVIIILIIMLIMALLYFLAGISLVSNYMKKKNYSYLYYKEGINIIPSADYIVIPGAEIKSNYPRNYIKRPFRLCFHLISS